MTTLEPTTVATARAGALMTLGLLLLGLVPWPESLSLISSAVENARSAELNRADREVESAGYYEGLIGGGDGPHGSRSELSLRLMGKPSGWIRFQDANVALPIPDDFLQFELRPNVRRSLFGKPFQTNSHGMPGAELSFAKPSNTFRIATLGSSMDMGWGVASEETYNSRLETWLNSHNKLRGLDRDDTSRNFQVMNFAVAAYSPLQRLEAYHRKARRFQPDLVLYAATMLDTRLLEIHLCDMLRSRVDLKYDFLKKIVEQAGITERDLTLDSKGELVYKPEIKAKMEPYKWTLYDATLGRLAEECRMEGTALAVVIIPRVGKADAPEARAEPVARLKAIAAHHGLNVYDLSATFDRFDPASLEIAAWDDHPNALGHQRLFLALARAISKDRSTYDLLFPENSPVQSHPGDSAEPLANPSLESNSLDPVTGSISDYRTP